MAESKNSTLRDRCAAFLKKSAIYETTPRDVDKLQTFVLAEIAGISPGSVEVGVKIDAITIDHALRSVLSDNGTAIVVDDEIVRELRNEVIRLILHSLGTFARTVVKRLEDLEARH